MCNIGGRLTSERKRLGCTQAQMAQQGGVSERSQANYESGARSPDLNYCSAIARAGADVQFIITGVRCERQKPDKNTRMLSDEQREILTLWRRVPMRAKSNLMGLLQQLAPHTDVSDLHIEVLDPDRVHDMTPEELEEHRKKHLKNLKSQSPATKAREKRLKAIRRKKAAHKEKENV
ncbi:MAG: helix-turn-helix domain-containing protein [Candidatus Thiodiazotropha sp. (ex Troendleina suluensis)]|nr:helix-turn-helix domain-containing protein [Candidatus Thiodiazotropha sp. (ex Troendleina suluensis)]